MSIAVAEVTNRWLGGSCVRIVAATCLLGLLAPIPKTYAATAPYMYVGIGTPKGSEYSAIYSLTDAGEISGGACYLYGYPLSCHERAFLYSSGAFTSLGTPPGFSSSEAVGLNGGSAIAVNAWQGPSYDGSTEPYVATVDGGKVQWRRLVGPGGKASDAYLVGTALDGTVFGSFAADVSAGRDYPVSWAPGSTTAKRLPMPRGYPNGDILAMDREGDSVGIAENYSTGKQANVVWLNGGRQLVRIPSNAYSAYLTGIAQSDVNPNLLYVVGNVEANSHSGDRVALWIVRRGTHDYPAASMLAAVLKPPKGDVEADATAVNGAGEIVSQSWADPDESHAIVYRDGVAMNLTSLLPKSQRASAVCAVAINESGQVTIECQGAYSPETSTPPGGPYVLRRLQLRTLLAPVGSLCRAARGNASRTRAPCRGAMSGLLLAARCESCPLNPVDATRTARHTVGDIRRVRLATKRGGLAILSHELFETMTNPNASTGRKAAMSGFWRFRGTRAQAVSAAATVLLVAGCGHAGPAGLRAREVGTTTTARPVAATTLRRLDKLLRSQGEPRRF